MASVKVIFKKDKIKKNGTAPLYLRIIKNRKPRYQSLGILLHSRHWDEGSGRVKKSHENSQVLNNYIASKIAEAEKLALELEQSDQNLDHASIKEAILGPANRSFKEYADAYLCRIEKAGRIRSYRNAKSALNKFFAFWKKPDIRFADLTYELIQAFDTYLRDELENAPNTIYSNMKVLKKLLSDAMREGIISMDKNPFTRYQLKWEKTTREYLTEAEIGLVENLELTRGTKKYHFRNMYIFSCYAGGLRISDVLQLRWTNFDGERISIRIHKTKEQLSFKLPQKAISILKSYQSETTQSTDFIFPVLKPSKDYNNPVVLHNALSSSTAYCNKELRWMAKKIGLTHNMSFHTSRHTWATRALRKGMRIEYVSKIMGHANIKTTQIYAKIVNSELDKAMEVFDE